jgi:hypothetical protein
MLRRPLALLLVGSCALSACGAAVVGAPSTLKRGPLRWTPPTLTAPKTIRLGEGYTETTLDPSRDYVVELPRQRKLGGVTLVGGHDVVIVGGHITVPARQPAGQWNNRRRTGLYIKGATGTVHVEGVLLDGAPGAVWDAITIAAPRATVQLEQIRIERVRGGLHGFHGDVVQPWGGVRLLRIDRLSASSNYQGLTIPIDKGPIGAAQISHVDLRGRLAGAEGGGHLVWLTTGSRTCRSYPVRLDDVYVQPRPGRPLAGSVWPQRGRPRCGARARGARVSWPRLRRVRGDVTRGVPAGGSYVPPGAAGARYRTLGYRGAG